MDNGSNKFSLLHIWMVGLIFHIPLYAFSPSEVRRKKTALNSTCIQFLGEVVGERLRMRHGITASPAAFSLRLFMIAFNTYLLSI